MKTCGVILAGGKSTRMGTNKALLQLNNQPVIERIADELQLISDELIIVANDPADYQYLNLSLISDRYPNKGPLAGIETAMYHFAADQYIISACDTPFIDHQVYQHLLSSLGGYDAVVPKFDNHLHPLSGVYTRQVLPIIQEKIEQNDLRVKSFFNHLNIHYLQTFNNIEKKQLEKHFFNMNNPDQYKQARDF